MLNVRLAFQEVLSLWFNVNVTWEFGLVCRIISSIPQRGYLIFIIFNLLGYVLNVVRKFIIVYPLKLLGSFAVYKGILPEKAVAIFINIVEYYFSFPNKQGWNFNVPFYQWDWIARDSFGLFIEEFRRINVFLRSCLYEFNNDFRFHSLWTSRLGCYKIVMIILLRQSLFSSIILFWSDKLSDFRVIFSIFLGGSWFTSIVIFWDTIKNSLFGAFVGLSVMKLIHRFLLNNDSNNSNSSQNDDEPESESSKDNKEAPASNSLENEVNNADTVKNEFESIESVESPEVIVDAYESSEYVNHFYSKKLGSWILTKLPFHMWKYFKNSIGRITPNTQAKINMFFIICVVMLYLFYFSFGWIRVFIEGYILLLIS